MTIVAFDFTKKEDLMVTERRDVGIAEPIRGSRVETTDIRFGYRRGKMFPLLNRLTAESRKYGGMLILGTQTDAQIDKVYGQYDTRIILQDTATKLILNCRDEQTAERVAKTIGRHERIDWRRGTSNQRTVRLWDIAAAGATRHASSAAV